MAAGSSQRAPGERGRSIARLLVLTVGSVYLASALWMPADGFWINDTALKFIQVRSIAEDGAIALDWPGRALDPHFEFGFLTRGFYARVDDALFAAYSPVFAGLSAPFYLLLGERGLAVLPLFGALLGLLAVWRLALLVAAGATAPRRAATLSVLAVAFATPLWFYALAFWEHTLALGLSCWSVWGLVVYRQAPSRRAAAITAVLAALPIYFRTEAYLFAAIVLALAAWSARRRPVEELTLATGLTAALLPLWVFHSWALGNPLGHHLMSQPWADLSFADYLGERARVASRLLLNLHADPKWSLAAALPFYAALLAGRRLRAQALHWAVPLAAIAAVAAGSIVLWGQLTALRPMNRLLLANGLFSASPLLILAFLRPDAAASPSAARVYRTLFGISVAYCIFYAGLIPGINSQGVHWGCRFLLPVYPLLAVLSSVTASAWWERGPHGRLTATAVAALFVLSVAFQIYSLILLHERKTFSATLTERVRASPAEIVVSDVWFVPVDLAGVFFEKPAFYAPAARRGVLLARARAAGVRSVLSIDSALRRAPSAGEEIVSDGWLRFAPVRLTEQQLGEP